MATSEARTANSVIAERRSRPTRCGRGRGWHQVTEYQRERLGALLDDL